MSELAAWISAISGFAGVVVGAGLTYLKEAQIQKVKTKKERDYLAILVASELDRFVAGCAEVVSDDGVPDQYGYYAPRVTPPKFEPHLLTVEWKALPSRLMYDVLRLPFRAEQASGYISSVGEHDDPPDFNEYFQIRQYEYARLGVAAATFAETLRNEIGIQDEPFLEWNPVSFMRERIERIERARSERATLLRTSVPQL